MWQCSGKYDYLLKDRGDPKIGITTDGACITPPGLYGQAAVRFGFPYLYKARDTRLDQETVSGGIVDVKGVFNRAYFLPASYHCYKLGQLNKNGQAYIQLRTTI